ncbi:Oidioi.mRNA.OKI2018_I69.PAR.g9365.t1.cds [Oikopleura dioica]|uniref:Oidioi.mRNA.OKI2018_I69.PAR.g9365.t1.cds n=1 Tax=Oikopleura dioica TaxID=34765 RepID=A0ABN7RQN8_OIKDI|nr:Oidioi.mRNA.OKI2018_I69.PAR.g9365.t1.cds [Oikopleura dioica]
MTVVVVEPQPVVYYQDPIPTYIEPAYPGTFKYGLFDTCCECCIHLEMLFCWYLRVQTVAEYFGSSGIGWCLLSVCFPWCTIAFQRQKVREMHMIEGHLCSDCAVATVACPCALLQIEGEANGFIKPACGGCCGGGRNDDTSCLRKLCCCYLCLRRLNGGIEPME